MKQNKIIPNLKLNLICLSAAYIAIGVVMLAFPQMSLPNLCNAIGVVAIIVGIIGVAFYFIRKSFLDPDQIGFAGGVAMILFGLFAVVRPEEFARGFSQILSFCVIGDSIVKLQFSMDLLRLKSSRWWVIVLIALATAGLSMGILLYPFADPNAKSFYTYVVLLTDGVVNIVTTAYLNIRLKKYQKAMASGTEEKL